MDISNKPFIVIVLKSSTNTSDVASRFERFGPAVQRLQGVKRIALSALKDAVVVVTETDNMDAVMKMATGYELRTDSTFKLPGLEDVGDTPT